MLKHIEFKDFDGSVKTQLQYYADGFQECIDNMWEDDFNEEDFTFLCNRLRHICEELDFEICWSIKEKK